MEQSGFNYDPIEDTEEYKKAMKRIQPVLDREFKGQFGLGLCHVIWHRQKELLRRCGIEWKTPAEMNRNVTFD